MDRKKILILALAAVTIALAALWLAGPLRTVLNKNNNTIKHIDINKLPVEVIDLGKVEDLDWVSISWNTRYIIPLRTALGEEGPTLVLPPILEQGKEMYIVDKPRGVGLVGIQTLCADVVFGCADCPPVTRYRMYINVTAVILSATMNNCTEILYLDVNGTYTKRLLISTPINGTEHDTFIMLGPYKVWVDTGLARPTITINRITTREGNVTIVVLRLS